MSKQSIDTLGISLREKKQWRKCCIEKYEILPTFTERYPTISREIIRAIDYFGNEFLKNRYGKNLIHFGPNGSGTGFFLVLNGQHDNKTIMDTLQEFYAFLNAADDSGVDTTEFDLPGAQWMMMYYTTMIGQALHRS